MKCWQVLQQDSRRSSAAVRSQGLSPLRSEVEGKGVLARVVGQLGNARCRLARSGTGTDRLQAEEMGLQGCGGQVGVGRAPPVSFRPVCTDTQQVRVLLLQHGEVLICVPSCRGLSLCLPPSSAYMPQAPSLVGSKGSGETQPRWYACRRLWASRDRGATPESHLNDSDAEFPVTRVGRQPKGHLGTSEKVPL